MLNLSNFEENYAAHHVFANGFETKILLGYGQVKPFPLTSDYLKVQTKYQYQKFESTQEHFTK